MDSSATLLSPHGRCIYLNLFTTKAHFYKLYAMAFRLQKWALVVKWLITKGRHCYMSLCMVCHWFCTGYLDVANVDAGNDHVNGN